MSVKVKVKDRGIIEADQLEFVDAQVAVTGRKVRVRVRTTRAEQVQHLAAWALLTR